jgi:polar amino acid transport system permease protein
MDFFDTFLNLAVLQRSLPMLLQGLWLTLQLGAASIVAGLIVGLIVAMLRMYAVAPVRIAMRMYIDVLRSIPLLVLLIVIYYALPFLGLRLSSFASALAALTLVSGAYTAEIFRAGIEAIPKGQFEAASALGLSPQRTMTDVVLPQAVRIVIPPLTNNSINVVKDTALASVVAMPDLLKQATQMQALTANPSPLIGAAVLYIAFLWPLVLLVSYLERRFNSGRRV